MAYKTKIKSITLYKMRLIDRITIVLAATLVFPACESGLFGEVGSGVSVDQEIILGDFDRISVCSYVDVYYTQTPGQQSITLTCDDNLINYYKIEVRNGELIVDCRRAFYNKIDTYLTVCSPSISGVKLSGSGDLYIDKGLTIEDEFTVKSSGSGDAEIADITASSATISLTGSGDAEVGRMIVSSAEFKSSGSGDIEGDEITAESISINTTGSGDCYLVCKDSGSISVQISGSGDVNLRGTARALVNISQNGSGDFDMSGLTLSGL